MDDLCTACRCAGRNLYFIGETGFYDLYSQILNEIQVFDVVYVRVCWECRALLARFQAFKTQAQQSYSQLMRQDIPKYALSIQPRLTIHQLPSTDYPLVKQELNDHLGLLSIEVDRIKSEPEVEHTEDTFVNGLEIEEEQVKNKKKARKKLKSVKKKKKVKVIEENGLSDGFSDHEPLEDTKDDVQDNLQYDVQIVNSVQYDVQDVVHDNVQSEVDKVEENTFICARCGLPFDDKIAFDKHVQLEHIKVAIDTKEVIKQPRVRSKEVLPEKPECAECGKVFSSRKTYRYHLNVLHKGQNRYPCPRCGKVYQWKSNLGRHLRTHKARDDGELYCELCDRRFASVATYRQHLRVSRRHVPESEFSFVCNDCGKKFVNKTRLRDHVDWEHLKKIKFRCQLCNKPFKCHTSLYVHMQNVHRNKEKKDNLCHVCGKSYQNAAKLKYHIVAMHTSETPYQCGQCAAAFGWYSSLYRHTREVHHKVKMQSKKSKKGKKSPTEIPQMPLVMPGPP